MAVRTKNEDGGGGGGVWVDLFLITEFDENNIEASEVPNINDSGRKLYWEFIRIELIEF